MLAAVPQDESARLAALHRYDILDTPQESDFDDLVRLAAQICGTPISLVSLVDKDRQWFKGRYGLSLPETPRRLSFCAHAILDAPAMTEVSDATRDPRFADNELVTGPQQMRFYASAPLVTPEGQPIGTLCVIDRQPRQLSAEQKEALRVLSRQVLMQLELRRRLAELRRSSSELAEANAELEGFAHAITHDLRAPLRATTGFAELLRDRYAGQLDEPAAEMLKQIERSGQRMSELLQDFMRLMRLRAQPLQRSVIDMRQLAQEISSDLVRQNGGAGSVFRWGEIPPACADRSLIAQVWVNLITNALKFSRQRQPPIIEIGGRKEPARLLYWIKDNGVGFDMNEVEQLWTPFRRLHGNEFEGTGLGLSIVKRILLRHSGDCWAESGPQAGATFYFTLPH